MATFSVQPSSARPRWYIWCAIVAITCAMTGVHWDISWHRSIGRDTFWTPAHMDIYLCGILAGISCGYLILATTFRRDSPLRKSSVALWGFRGPLGAFIAAWGGIAMLTSAPFDDWWHNAYGLDVKILSPPHMVLAAGMIAVHIGALILILGQMNRAEGVARDRLRRLYLYVAGMILVSLSILQMEMVFRSAMHQVHEYHLIALISPVVLTVGARSSGSRWGATAVAGVYSAFVLLMSWILPLFPAEPKLGPVYYPVTHFVPPEFPLLLIVPAIALDLLWQRTVQWNQWTLAAVSALVFLGVFIAVQWPFADFLMTPAARNWFFGTKYFSYFIRPTSVYLKYLFLPTETGAAFWQECALTFATAALTIRFGLATGNWMRGIRR
jgi:hypothetical protein